MAISTKEVTAIWLGGGCVSAMGMGSSQGDPHSIMNKSTDTMTKASHFRSQRLEEPHLSRYGMCR